MITYKDKKEGGADRAPWTCDGEGSRRSKPPTTNDVMMLIMNPEFEVVDFNEFDIILTDIKRETIRKLVVGGCKHHTEVETNNAELPTPASLPGVTYGDYQRVLVKADVFYRKRLNVIMLVDTGSPYTFLTRETLEALGVKIDDQPSDHVFVVINGMRVKVGVSKAHFKDVDVLGTSFLQYCDLHVNYPSETATVAVLPLVPDAAAAAAN